MPKPLVYIETTIPSFYHEVRTAPNIVARRDWTRLWWSDANDHYLLTTSLPVIEELQRGNQEQAASRLALVSGLPLLPVEAAIAEIVLAYIRHQLMPANPAGDALHLALASFHKCEFLLTWNCLHLANANKFGHIRRINTMLGLYTPIIATPLELMGGTNVSEGSE